MARREYIENSDAMDDEVDIEEGRVSEDVVSSPRKSVTTTTSSYIRYGIVGGISLLILLAIGAMILFMMITKGPEVPHGDDDPNVIHTKLFEGRNGAVATDVPICSEIGLKILQQRKGNAVDAAIASALCIGVVNSASSGIGGGAIMLVSTGDEVTTIDSREKAPLAAHKDMFTNLSTIESERGGLSIAVPGEVKGLYTAWERYGSLPWRDLVTPSIDLARNGYKVTKYLYSKISKSPYKEWILDGTYGTTMREVYAPNGQIANLGDTIKNTRLANTLEQIAEHGMAAFYDTQHKLARDILEDIQSAGGIITSADLQSYNVKVAEAISTYYHGYKVYGAKPEISGGACVLFILNILERYQLDEFDFSSPTFQHLVIEAMKFAFGHRMELGDPDFVNSDATKVLTAMLDKDYAAMIRRKYLKLNETSLDLRTYLPHFNDSYIPLKAPVPNGGTAHLSTVDSNRMAVSITSTVNLIFGSFVMGERTGIVFNDEMDDFSVPGRPNAFNLPPSEANFIAPGKRPLSSMSPTIVHQDGQFKMSVGASGGPYIITSTASVLLNALSLGMPIHDAINRPRFHHQLIPARVDYEKDRNYGKGVLESLERAGHVLNKISPSSISQGIVETNKGVLQAASDFRKDSVAAAY